MTGSEVGPLPLLLLCTGAAILFLVRRTGTKKKGNFKAEQKTTEVVVQNSTGEGQLQATEAEEVCPPDAAPEDKEQQQEGTAATREEESGAQEPRRIEPVKRGGRRRLESVGRRFKPPLKDELKQLKPELVCRKGEQRDWLLLVELPEYLLRKPGLKVYQDGAPLRQGEFNDNQWRVETTAAPVFIQWDDRENGGLEVQVAGDEYLLFRLSGQRENRGRRVKAASCGSYLVVAPEAWVRDEDLSDPAPFEPEPTALQGLRAHFFIVEDGSEKKIAFKDAAGNSRIIPSKKSLFRLSGSQLNDSDVWMGPFFGGEPPRLCSSDSEGWGEVETIVIGEEGASGERRKAFQPDQDRIEQDLPRDILSSGKGGWYFLRFYNKDGNLIESFDFRYMSALRDIAITQPPPLPSEGGHQAICVDFMHDTQCDVQLVGVPTEGIEIQREGVRTRVHIPPNPDADETTWAIGITDGPRVRASLLVERLWWGLGEEGVLPKGWKGTPLTLFKSDFAATSKKVLWLRLPRERWTKGVVAGIAQTERRYFPARVMEKTVPIPLRNLGDSVPPYEGEENLHSLKVCVDSQRNIATEGIVAFISDDEPVEQPKQAERPANSVGGIYAITPSRLATVLTRLKRRVHGPLRLLIKDVYRQRPKRRGKSTLREEQFLRYGLCLVAFLVKEGTEREGKFKPPLSKGLLRAVAITERQFPSVAQSIQERYRELKSGRSRSRRTKLWI